MGKFHNAQALLTKFVKTTNAQSQLNKIHIISSIYINQLR